jgi:hypothetical protein
MRRKYIGPKGQDQDVRLPHHLEAERSVLGSILLDPNAFHRANEILDASDFFLDWHRRIFARMEAMAAANISIDLLTMHEELERAGELEAAGGAAYLSSLVDGVPRVSNVEAYCHIVREKAQRRRMVKAAYRLAEGSQDGTSLAELARIVEEIVPALYEKRREQKQIFVTAAEIAAESGPEVKWVAKPWIAKGTITELDGKVKLAGKTTFKTHLVRAVLDGETFMGEPTTKSPVVFLTEQPKASFRVALRRADLLGREDLIVLYRSRVIGLTWDAICRLAVEECKRRSAGLLVVDTLSQFAGLEGDEENNAGDALAAMAPLQAATDEGLGVLVGRHERKSGGLVGESGRGSSAFGGVADIILSLRRLGAKSRRTVRVIEAEGRFDETPDELVIELQDDGYVALGKSADLAQQEAENAIRAALPDSEDEALKLRDLIEETKVARGTAQRVLRRMVSDGAVLRVGAGKRSQPFRYFRAENRGQSSSAQASTTTGQKENLPPEKGSNGSTLR